MLLHCSFYSSPSKSVGSPDAASHATVRKTALKTLTDALGEQLGHAIEVWSAANLLLECTVTLLGCGLFCRIRCLSTLGMPIQLTKVCLSFDTCFESVYLFSD